MKMVLAPQNLLITGLPGTGKTTLIKKLSAKLEEYRPLGFYTTEIREGGQRLGFEIVSLDGKRGLLFHVNIESPYRVGKYRVDVRGFENFLDAIPFFDPASRLILIDEIGKMECLSNRFQSLVRELLDSEKWVIATVALKGEGLIDEVKKRKDVKMFELSERNRDYLWVELLEEVKTSLLVR